MYHDLGVLINKIKPLPWIGIYHDLGVLINKIKPLS